MRLLSFFIIASILFSCKKDKGPICTTPPQPVLIRLIDTIGQDLLDPANTNAYPIHGMSLTYLDNGATKYSSIAINSIPATDSFYLSTDIAWLANTGRDFYLKLSANDTDTISLKYDQLSENGCSYYKLNEFKYNGVAYLQKQLIMNQPPVFEITK